MFRGRPRRDAADRPLARPSVREQRGRRHGHVARLCQRSPRRGQVVGRNVPRRDTVRVHPKPQPQPRKSAVDCVRERTLEGGSVVVRERGRC